MSNGFQSPTHSYGPSSGRYLLAEVVNVNDPEQSGRVQIRVIGYQEGIQESDLRWARIKHSPTNPMNNGVGGPGVGLMVGSHVFAQFLDAEGQQCIIDGTIAAPKSMDDTGMGKDKNMADMPPHTRTNNDQYGQAGDLRYMADKKDHDIMSIAKYGVDESPNAYGKTNSKDPVGFTLGTYEYMEV